MDMDLIWRSLPALLDGTLVTLELVGLSVVIGLVMAVGIALARLSSVKLLSVPAASYVFLIRSTPLLVQMFLLYYGLGQFEAVRGSFLWPLLREPFACAIIALALNTAAYTGEIIRGGVRAVPFGQIEAARAIGMHTVLLYRRIILPQAFRQALPAYGNELIQMVQATSLASTITLMDLTGVAKSIAARTFQPMEVFLIAGAIYLVLNFLVTRAVRAAEARFHPV